MKIQTGYKKNFATLQRACKSGDLALLDCQDKATGKPVRVIVAISHENGEYVIVPLAKMFDGNPYDELNPPNADAPDGYDDAR